MWTTKTKLWYVAYRALAAWLPESRHAGFAKRLRRALARRVIAQCGNDVNIERHAAFTPLLKIGDRSGVGIRCEINGDVTIGCDVMMGPEVVIYTTGHRFDRTDIPMREQGDTEPRPVVIEDDVWIGRRAMILPGVRVGKGSVIAAGAVVTRDVEPYTVVGGVPARVLRRRDGAV